MSVDVKLRWITPDAERQIVGMARVSSDPTKATRPDIDLIRYLIRNRHVSPFQMASMCVEISGASRAVTRQMLRHRSLNVQEFSQRYQDAFIVGDMVFSEARMQHPTNRQASLPAGDDDVRGWWKEAQADVAEVCADYYRRALLRGIAKEVARTILPEGMTSTRLMVSATVRDWLHYCDVRRGSGTQPEHVEIADAIWGVMKQEMPTITTAFEGAGQ